MRINIDLSFKNLRSTLFPAPARAGAGKRNKPNAPASDHIAQDLPPSPRHCDHPEVSLGEGEDETKPNAPASDHIAQDLPPSPRHCDVHLEVSLREDEDETSYPKSAAREILLMKIAAKRLERRAAKLEIERRENEAIRKEMGRPIERRLVSLDEPANNHRDSKSLPFKSKDSSDSFRGRQDEITALVKWSMDLEHSSSQLCLSKRKWRKSGKSSSANNNGSIVSGSPCLITPQFSLGQVAQPFEMDIPSSNEDALIKITRLSEGDGAWVKRSGDGWTYATLKKREHGRDASLIFTINGGGSKKTIPVTGWAKYVRIVAEDLSDDVDSESMTGSDDAKPIRDSSFRGCYGDKGEVVVVEDHEVSMFTLGANGNSPAVLEVLQDHELSMYTLDGLGLDDSIPLTTISASSHSAGYDTDEEEANTLDESTGASKVEQTFQRSKSQLHAAKHKGPNESSKRRPASHRGLHRVSWTEEPDKIKEDTKVDTEKDLTKKPPEVNSSKRRPSSHRGLHRVSWSGELDKVKEDTKVDTKKDPTKNPPEVNSSNGGKVKKISKRSKSLPLVHRHGELKEPNESPKRRPSRPQLKQNVSGIKQIKNDIKIPDTRKRPSVNSSLEKIKEDTEVDTEKDPTKKPPEVNSSNGGKVKKISKRSKSLPLVQRHSENKEPDESPKRQPSRPQLKHQVSGTKQIKNDIKIPDTRKRPSVNSSLDKIKEDTEVDTEKDPTKKPPEFNSSKGGKVKKISKRSKSLPLVQRHRENKEPDESPKRQPSRPQLKHQVSGTKQIKNDIKIPDTRKRPSVNSSNGDVPKNQLRVQPNHMGKSIPKRHELVKEESFKSALKSILKRELSPSSVAIEDLD